jgi:very-short-patch-repair endonuclease
MNQQSMFYGATPEIFKKAAMLRHNETIAEKILWSKLRNNQIFGCHFRRQHPISTFVADFYCHKLKLVIEVDEQYHLQNNQCKRDELRDQLMLELGLNVLRFSEDEVLNNLEGVINVITKYSLLED